VYPVFDQTAELYDLFYDWKDYRAEAERIRELVGARQPQARSLLDVACGTGRHLDHLRQWYAVEGLDLDRSMLAVAARRLPDTPLHVGDMADFDLDRQFDVVTCLFSSIGYMHTIPQLCRALKTMARHLAPGGLLILEPWLGPADFDPHHLGRLIVAERPELKAVRMNDSRVDGRLSIMDFHYLIARPGAVEHIVETHALGLFTEQEYGSALSDAGLTIEHDSVGLMGRGLWIGQRPSPEGVGPS
jgi:SAM-dependent methyltransferase